MNGAMILNRSAGSNVALRYTDKPGVCPMEPAIPQISEFAIN
jgi:hypothetical protein